MTPDGSEFYFRVGLGGFSTSAIVVTRLVDGQEQKIKVAVQDIALGKAPNFTLEPGDIVYVPESLF